MEIYKENHIIYKKKYIKKEIYIGKHIYKKNTHKKGYIQRKIYIILVFNSCFKHDQLILLDVRKILYFFDYVLLFI